MPYNQNFNTNKQTYIKTITIIHLALLTGQVLFAVVAFSINGKTAIDFKTDNNPYIIVVPIMAIGCFIAGNLVFKQLLNTIANKPALKDKLVAYQGALITRFALLEGASLFGIVTYMLTGNLLLLLISGLIILYFITLRPAKDKIEEDLNLSFEDKLEFDRVD